MSKIYGYARCSLAEEKGQDLKDLTLEEMDMYWNEAKRN